VILPSLERGHELPLVHSPEHLTKALCAGNRVEEVRFERHQNERSQHSAKQNSANFSQLEGDVFRTQTGKGGAETGCMLMPASYLKVLQNAHVAA
jgi:hypothetical protein